MERNAPDRHRFREMGRAVEEGMRPCADRHPFRERMKRLRDGICAQERDTGSRRIAERLCSLGWYGESRTILVYSAIRSEVDLGAFCRQAWRDNKSLYFPRVEQEAMEFCRVDSPKELSPGSFSVMEPGMSACRLRCADWSTETVPILVPGVAFSLRGDRIGYGKGYYDRYLAAHPQLMPVGVCFEAQLAGAGRCRAAFGDLQCLECGERESGAWEPMAHDRRMEWIVTECRVYRARP